MKALEAESIRLAKELLFWHEYIRQNRTAATVTQADLIPYKKLCERAGLPDAYRIVGHWLGEIAAWCAANNLPPLNSLAINGIEMKPGPGYDTAEGCSEINWWNEVTACINEPSSKYHLITK